MFHRQHEWMVDGHTINVHSRNTCGARTATPLLVVLRTHSLIVLIRKLFPLLPHHSQIGGRYEQLHL